MKGKCQRCNSYFKVHEVEEEKPEGYYSYVRRDYCKCASIYVEYPQERRKESEKAIGKPRNPK